MFPYSQTVPSPGDKHYLQYKGCVRLHAGEDETQSRFTDFLSVSGENGEKEKVGQRKKTETHTSRVY